MIDSASKDITKGNSQNQSSTKTTSTTSTATTFISASTLSSANSNTSPDITALKAINTSAETSSSISTCTNPSYSQSSTNTTWKETIHNEISTTLPMAARELVQTSLRTIVYHARISYAARGLRHHRNSDIGNSSGYIRPSEAQNENNRGDKIYEQNVNLQTILEDQDDLPPFSSLSWVDRQLVAEWRTLPIKSSFLTSFPKQVTKPHRPSNEALNEASIDTALADADYELARLLIPKPISCPARAMSDRCQTCQKVFSRVRNRHHCRLCGGSFCHDHSNCSHLLPHLDYDPNGRFFAIVLCLKFMFITS